MRLISNHFFTTEKGNTGSCWSATKLCCWSWCLHGQKPCEIGPSVRKRIGKMEQVWQWRQNENYVLGIAWAKLELYSGDLQDSWEPFIMGAWWGSRVHHPPLNSAVKDSYMGNLIVWTCADKLFYCGRNLVWMLPCSVYLDIGCYYIEWFFGESCIWVSVIQLKFPTTNTATAGNVDQRESFSVWNQERWDLEQHMLFQSYVNNSLTIIIWFQLVNAWKYIRICIPELVYYCKPFHLFHGRIKGGEINRLMFLCPLFGKW